MVIVTGASSFVGAHTAGALVAALGPAQVLGLVHRHHVAGVASLALDLTAGNAAKRLASLGPTTIVHVACRLTDPAANAAMLRAVLDACREAGAGLIHASTTQVGWRKKNRYAVSRALDEAAVVASGVPHVILRPCAPYGPRVADLARPETFQRLADAVVSWPIVPIPGPGTQLRQPLHVADWGEVVARCVGLPAAVRNRSFDVGGPRVMSMAALVDKLMLVAGRRSQRVIAPIPALQLAARLGVRGLDADTLATLDCDDTVDLGPISAAVDKPTWVRFEDGARDLVAPGWRRS